MIPTLYASIIEAIQNNVEDDDVRRDVYRDLIETFLIHDTSIFEDCLDIDPIFDLMYDEETSKKDTDTSDEETDLDDYWSSEEQF